MSYSITYYDRIFCNSYLVDAVSPAVLSPNSPSRPFGNDVTSLSFPQFIPLQSFHRDSVATASVGFAFRG